MTPRRVLFTASAEADLEEIATYIATMGGLRVALGFVESIRAYCQGFDLFPERRVERGDGTRRVGFRRTANIVFRLRGDAVEIVNIEYGGRIRPPFGESS